MRVPKSPSSYDLVRNAIEECDVPLAEDDTCPGKATLVVPEDTEIVQRRNQILDLMAEGDRNPLSQDQFDAADFLAAKDEKVVLAPQQTPNWIAPHFVWAVQKELTTKLCGEDVPTCTALETGGLRITTTLENTIKMMIAVSTARALIEPRAA